MSKDSMRLVGVRFVNNAGDSPRVFAELHLDPAGRVVVPSGHETAIAHQALNEGVETGGDAPLAVMIGTQYGIMMPEQSRRFTANDGPQFLVAMLAVYGKTGGYTSLLPVVEDESASDKLWKAVRRALRKRGKKPEPDRLRRKSRKARR